MPISTQDTWCRSLLPDAFGRAQAVDSRGIVNGREVDATRKQRVIYAKLGGDAPVTSAASASGSGILQSCSSTLELLDNAVFSSALPPTWKTLHRRPSAHTSGERWRDRSTRPSLPLAAHIVGSLQLADCAEVWPLAAGHLCVQPGPGPAATGCPLAIWTGATKICAASSGGVILVQGRYNSPPGRGDPGSYGRIGIDPLPGYRSLRRRSIRLRTQRRNRGSDCRTNQGASERTNRLKFDHLPIRRMRTTVLPRNRMLWFQDR